MQAIIDRLKRELGVRVTEGIVNRAIATRRLTSDLELSRDAVEMYLAAALGGQLSVDDRATFVDSIMQLDSAIVSVTLE